MNTPTAQRVQSARALLRSQFRIAHELLEAAIEEVTEEGACDYPDTDGQAEACYAHVVLCEDLCVNGVLACGTPLALSTWAGRTGVSEVPLLVRSTEWRAWRRQVRINLAELRCYARAVYTATDDYLVALPDSALDSPTKEIQVPVLNALLLTLSARCGEIASQYLKRWAGTDGTRE